MKTAAFVALAGLVTGYAVGVSHPSKPAHPITCVELSTGKPATEGNLYCYTVDKP